MSKNSDSLIAFLAGAVTGVILGVLYAPDTGKNTRDNLSFQLENYKEQLQALMDDFLKEQESAENPARTEAEKVVNEAKDKAEKLLEDVEMIINQIRNR